MAAVLNFDRLEAPTRAESDQAIETIIAHIESLPARLAVPRITAYKARLDAAEAKSLATVIDDKGDTKVAEAIANKRNVSSRSRKRYSIKATAPANKPAMTANEPNAASPASAPRTTAKPS